MNKIISPQKAQNIAKDLKKTNKKIVVTGGCFDILHIGHIKLFQKSKGSGDTLFVLLENDKNVKKIKGNLKPINTQDERAEILSELKSIDYIVKLPEMKSNSDYDMLISKIAPDIITTTVGNPKAVHNERQAKKIGAKVIYVIKRIENKSSSNLAKIISEKFN